MQVLRFWLTVGCLVLLGACGTTPTSNYYLLTAQVADQPGGSAPALGIGPVQIPEYLNRNGLVTSTQGNQIQIATFERWAEPLEDGVQRVLALNLSALLATQNVRFFPWQEKLAPDYGISMTVISLDIREAEALLVAEWVVSDPGANRELIRRISQARTAVSTGDVSGAAIAGAYSQLLYAVSREIADVIQADLTAAEPDER